ncbi:MAG: RNA polymerase sigma factor [Lachnospiraceae bacterium]|nr:RNA polymerase sigma factor [Lachnospiraceae bacterium]
MLTDTELYNKYLSGDGASYDELMIRYGDKLTIYLNGYLHNLQDAEDLMIEAFARIMVKKPAIRDGGFRAYLYKTARNLATRFHGIKSRFETFSLDGMEDEIPDRDTSDFAKTQILHLCLERIDPELKEALWLVYMDEMSYEDAAGIMKVSKKRIDRLLQKGKAHLRNELSKEGITNAYE